MNLEVATAYRSLRERVRAFSRESWPLAGAESRLSPREQEILWQKRAIAAGWLHRTVPTRYGGGGLPPDVLAETIIAQEFVAAKVPFLGSTPNGPRFLVPALLEFGTEDQRQRYISPTLTGELNWCQGYSEPDAGSDLASLRCRASLDAEEWVLEGQKVWTSLADRANMMFGLFRTEPDRPRHMGISFLLVPMSTPGVVVRPLATLHGSLEFCEVFFDGARIPAGNIVGERGSGWAVSRSVLKHERLMLADSSYVRGQFDELVELAKRVTGPSGRAIDDPHVRQRLVEIEGWVASQELSVARILTELHRGRDEEVAAEMLTGKLLGTHTQEAIARMGMDLLGDEGLYEPGDSEITSLQFMRAGASSGDWVNRYFASLASALGGGTSNIHRNLIGERLLGQPRDPRPSRG